MSSKFANAALSGKLTGKQALEEMLSMTKEEAVESGVDIQDIKISELHEFKDHPFHVLDNEDMDLLVSSIQENGIIVPILVRKRSLGGYEIISGHRRTTAAKKAGLVSVPAIIQELSDDDAVICMVDANLQRENILPSEKAKSMKQKLQAVKHKKASGAFDQFGQNFNARDLVAEEAGESSMQVQRYLRLNYLKKDLLDMVDSKKLGFNVGVNLSYLTQEQQDIVVEALVMGAPLPALKQSKELKRTGENGEFSNEIVKDILLGNVTQNRKITLGESIIKKYFDAGMDSEEIREIIISLIDNWKKAKEG